MDPTPQEVADALRPALGQLYRRIRQTKAAGGVTLSESSALGRLDRHGPATGAELAKLEQVSPQSIGATVQALQSKGLITRAPDPADGRRVIVSLTDAGRGVVQSRRARGTEALTRAREQLSAQERARLLDAVPVIERLSDEL